MTSGGVSVGEADFTRAADEFASATSRSGVSRCARAGRSRSAGCGPVARPGDGRIGALLRLAGQPGRRDGDVLSDRARSVAAMSGATPRPLPVIHAVSHRADPQTRRAAPNSSAASRAATTTGSWHVTPTGSQGSGVLSSMSEANCFIVLGHDAGEIDAGDASRIMLFDGLI